MKPTPRERTEAREERVLAPCAARSANHRGRDRDEPECPVRAAFQHDCHRIVHSKAFRRLKGKTQVFLWPEGDHYRTRLTHCQEVSQIARTLARTLALNEDLTEAIALGHDLGHTPFGHTGERALAELLPEGFRHNEQSLRVVERLENGGRGLNLTWEVREGILKHSKVREDILAEGWGTASTLEAQIVKLADSVAYLNHDIADAVRAGLLREEDLPSRTRAVLGTTHAERINALVLDLVETSWAATGEGSPSPPEEPPRIAMSDTAASATNELRNFMFSRVYEWEAQQEEATRARRVVRFLFEHFLGHPEAITSDFTRPDDPPVRRVADYIAGMTDLYAQQTAESLGLRP